MLSQINSNVELKKLVVSTGNILNVNNQLAQKTSEELVDGIQLALQSDRDTTNFIEDNEKHKGHVLRGSKELEEKINEHKRSDLGIGAKIFINNDSPESIEQAIHALLQVLQVQHIDNVVLAYYPHAQAPQTPEESKPHDFKWSGSGSKQCVERFNELWRQLEEHVLRKEILLLGVCDLDADMLANLHKSARIPPTIAQINLASCCVVPPTLQEFCTQHDIQLLTHSDPEIILPRDSAIIPEYQADWTVRYQVHVRCRGIVAAKGYILGASRRT